MHYNKLPVQKGQMCHVHSEIVVFHAFFCDIIIFGCTDSGVWPVQYNVNIVCQLGIAYRQTKTIFIKAEISSSFSII